MIYVDYPDMLDVPLCCKLLGCGKTKVYQLAARGELRTFRIGRKMLIPKAEVIKLIENKLKESGNILSGVI